jgi:hypothetical protein
MPPVILLLPFFGRWIVCGHTAIFSAKPVPKNAGNIHFVFQWRFGVSQTGADNGLRRFFHQIKVCKRIGRKEEECEDTMNFCMKQKRTLFKNSSSKLKKPKTYSG